MLNIKLEKNNREKKSKKIYFNTKFTPQIFISNIYIKN